MNDDTEMPAVFARCFRGTDGERALTYLRRLTIERRLAPDASDAELRHLEGQRHLAALVAQLVARGTFG